MNALPSSSNAERPVPAATDKTLAAFLCDWNAAGRPDFIDGALFTALGYVMFCAGHVHLCRDGLPPAVLESHPYGYAVTAAVWSNENEGSIHVGYAVAEKIVLSACAVNGEGRILRAFGPLCRRTVAEAA